MKRLPSRFTRTLSRSSWKFFLAGEGMSFRTGRYFVESALVGAFAGVVVVAFRYLIDWAQKFFMEWLGHHQSLSRLTDGAAIGRMYSVEALLDGRRWLLVVLPALAAHGEAALAGHRRGVALRLQLVVRPLDGVRVDGKAGGKFPDRWHLFLRPQRTGQNQLTKRSLDLLIDRPGIAIVNLNQMNHFP